MAGEQQTIAAGDVGSVSDVLGEPTIAAGVGVSANATPNSGASGKARAARIQQAMSDAVIEASAKGLRVDADAAEVRAMMMAARQRILDEENAPPKANGEQDDDAPQPT